MTSQGEVQYGRCTAPCEHWRVCMFEAKKRGSPWGDFCAQPGAAPSTWINLTQDYWEGPATNCPAGYWKGLVPLSAEALAAQQEQNRLGWAKVQVTRYGPMLQIALKGDDEASVTSKLESMVEAGQLQPEAAAQIAQTIPKV